MSDADHHPDGHGADASAGDPDASTTESGSEAGESIDFGELKAREAQRRQSTKEFVIEYDDGATAVFEYQMIDGLDEIADKHTTTRPTRSGQEDDVEVDKYAFAREVLSKGLVDAPDGFEATERALREDLTDELVDDLVEAVAEYSSMPESVVRQFRGGRLRE